MYSFVLRSDPAFCSSVSHVDTRDLHGLMCISHPCVLLLVLSCWDENCCLHTCQKTGLTWLWEKKKKRKGNSLRDFGAGCWLRRLGLLADGTGVHCSLFLEHCMSIPSKQPQRNACSAPSTSSWTRTKLGVQRHNLRISPVWTLAE